MQLEEKGISVEVLDLRTISPLDMDTITTSVKKTGRVIIYHQACKTGGIGAEIGQRIQEKAFDYLDVPIRRVAAKDAPIPQSKILENEILPSEEHLILNAIEMMGDTG